MLNGVCLTMWHCSIIEDV